MSNFTYSAKTFKSTTPSGFGSLWRELFWSTPLGLIIRALKDSNRR